MSAAYGFNHSLNTGISVTACQLVLAASVLMLSWVGADHTPTLTVRCFAPSSYAIEMYVKSLFDTGSGRQ